MTVTPESPTCTGFVGVIYWQAPEVRAYVHQLPFRIFFHRLSPVFFFYSGAYNPMKVDIWSLGATVWEMAESTPPFHDAVSTIDLRDRWPPLTRAGEFSRSLHDFLTLCSNPVASRPDSSVLLQVRHIFLPFFLCLLTRIGICRRLLFGTLLGGLLLFKYSRNAEQSRAYCRVADQA